MTSEAKWIVGTGLAVCGLMLTLNNSVRNDLSSMRTEIGSVRTEIGSLRTDMMTEIGSLRTDMMTEIGNLRTEIRADLRRMDDRLRAVEIAFGKVDQRLETLERIILPDRPEANQ